MKPYDERYCKVDRVGGILTDEELKEGWHFCWDWNGMLVGQTKNFDSRSKEHFRGKEESSTLVDRKIAENEGDVLIEVLEEVEDRVQANDRERYWIESLDTHVSGNGYNIDLGGYGDGREISDETRRRYSESKRGSKNPMFGKPGPRRGVKLSEETKRKIRDSKLKNPRVISSEEREKIRAKMLGHTTSQETRDKISKANKGRPKPDHVRKMVGDRTRGKRWYTDGVTNILVFERDCPSGFTLGQTKALKKERKKNETVGNDTENS